MLPTTPARFSLQTMSFTKHKAQILHAKKRAKERLGIDLTPDMRQRLIRDIQKGHGRFLYRQSGRISVWEVWVAGKRATVIYDSDRHSIVTFLPKRATRREPSFYFVSFTN